MARAPRASRWIYALAAAPYGCFNGIVAVALPFLLRQRGLSVDRIAVIAALVQTPAVWYVLWSPVVDAWLRRRTWLIALSVASALCTMLALSTASLQAMTALLVLASGLAQPVSSAIGGLVAATVPDDMRGRVGGWTQAGMLSGGVVAGGSTVWLASHLSVTQTAVIDALLIALPSFFALAVKEPAPPRRQPVAWLADMAGALASMIRRRETWLGFFFFLSPAGAGALLNLFSALAADFQASPRAVIVGVAAAGVMTPVGALIGGAACDRFDRWRVYAAAGLLSAAAAAGMAIAPLRPATYIIGGAAYALATGFAYAAFTSLAFELVGSTIEASGTRFALFMAAVNIPVVYMIRLDGIGHAHLGTRGMLGVDAAANALFGVILLTVAHARAADRGRS